MVTYNRFYVISCHEIAIFFSPILPWSISGVSLSELCCEQKPLKEHWNLFGRDKKRVGHERRIIKKQMQGFLHNAFKKVQGFLYSCLAYFSFQKTSWGFTFLLSNNSSHLFGKKSSHLGVFCKKVFLKISQKFKTNTCDGVSFLIKLLAESLQLYKKGNSAHGFSCKFCKFFLLL